jgi:SAM-dependent methyltransferase
MAMTTEAATEPRNVFELDATVEGWDADYYHPVAERYYDEAVPAMLRAMGAQPGDRVLDGGCGPGVHAIRAARYGCEVTAIDLSEKMLEHARRRAEGAGLSDRIEFRQADLTQIDFAGECFPFVFSWGVVIHVPDADAALRNLARVTAPGGALALHLLNRTSLDWRFEKAVRRMTGKRLNRIERTPLGEGVWYDYNGERLWVQRFDADDLTVRMGELGFRLEGRRAMEATELQWRLKSARLGGVRAVMLHGNRLAWRAKVPAGLAATQLFIFRKEG